MARLRRPSLGGSLVLDAEGLGRLADGDPRATFPFEVVRRRRGVVAVAAPTLTEVLRGGRRDTKAHRVLADIEVIAIDRERARAAGELLGRTGLSGHRCAIDALVAVVALAQPRPVVLLTSDTEDLVRLTEEPERPRRERVMVVRI